jgi:hypothetical protein
MTNLGSDAPDVRVIPPLVYVVGLVVGLFISVWVPTKVVQTCWHGLSAGFSSFVGRLSLVPQF